MNIPHWVLRGKELAYVYATAKKHQFALPAVNVVGNSSINAAMEAAKEANAPIIIQFSHGWACFNAGKSLDKWVAGVAGAVAGALHIHEMAQHYGVSAILHTDHAARKLLPWIDGLLDAGEAYFEQHGRPLYSSHMIDLSDEPIEDNLSTSVEYFTRMAKIGMSLEVEIGITWGEEDGVDNTNIDNALLYTQPEDVNYAYEQLKAVDDNFTIAAAFGNVHGVYKPGNVVLTPQILDNSQKFVSEKHGTHAKPIDFVFHGWSGSEPAKIKEALWYGVVKMNIDTDTQWAFWDGVRAYEAAHHDYLQGQIGNPDGDDTPNKSKYDPRVWMRAGEVAMKDRLLQAFKDLQAIDSNQYL